MAKILIVDDDADFRQVCRVVLEQGGFEICEAGGPEEGLVSDAEVPAPLAAPERRSIATAARIGHERSHMRTAATHCNWRMGQDEYLRECKGAMVTPRPQLLRTEAGSD